MQDPQTQTELKLAKYYLVNLAFYFIPLFIMPVSPWQWLASLLVLPPFIYCYFCAYGALGRL
ncbi:sensor histidine kinase, partial [Shewanella algae]|nr:sensor histidine kinase [Shewanella algae]